MPESVVTCYGCSAKSIFEGPVPRGAECDGCGARLRCCLSCEFYDQSAYNDCREPSAERVVDKEAANFCDYFSAAESGGCVRDDGSGAALDKLEDLFGKK